MRDIASRVALTIAIALVAALMAVAAMGFALAAVYLGLVTVLSPAWAALATAGAALLSALLTVGVARLFMPRPSRPSSGSLASSGVAAALGSTLGKDLSTWAKTHQAEICTAALATGFAIGISGRLRRALLRLIA